MQAGMPAVLVSRKKIALEPLSMKASVLLPLAGYLVRKVPMLSSGRTFAWPRALLSRVPMPKTRAPVTLAAPSAGTAGNSIMVPLLSWLKSAIGFQSCLEIGTAAALHPPFAVEEHL